MKVVTLVNNIRYSQPHIFEGPLNNQIWSGCIHTAAAAAAKSLQSCSTLCDPKDCSPPGSSVHGILQARLPEWVAIPSPGDLPDPGIELTSLLSPALAGGFFTI